MPPRATHPCAHLETRPRVVSVRLTLVLRLPLFSYLNAAGRSRGCWNLGFVLKSASFAGTGSKPSDVTLKMTMSCDGIIGFVPVPFLHSPGLRQGCSSRPIPDAPSLSLWRVPAWLPSRFLGLDDTELGSLAAEKIEAIGRCPFDISGLDKNSGWLRSATF
jgi:hypothetical protein